MGKRNSSNVFYGKCGEFLVAAALSKKELHAAVLTGNAANIDLLVSTKDGRRSVSIQVKSANNCLRRKRLNAKMVVGRYWLVGHVPNTIDENLWYAFVDLKDENRPLKDAEIFFVPSKWVTAYTFVMEKMPYFFVSDEMLASDVWGIDSFKQYMEGVLKCPDIPSHMAWVGENEGKTTKEVLFSLKQRMLSEHQKRPKSN